jgi:hypothetical protein
MADDTCSVADCNAPVRARTYCNKHYLRWQNNGHPLVTNYGKPAEGLTARVCEVCDTVYQPYRKTTRWCSEQCKYRHPDYRQRKATARRIDTAKDPEHQRELNLRNALHRYSMTVMQYRALVAAQGGRCAVCGDAPKPDGIKAAARLHVDHDHITGVNRGLLCGRCNMGIGYFRERPDLLTAATAYIREHNGAVDGRRYTGTGWPA